MRDPNRIDRFCDMLKSVWHCVPDWRFGQLVINLLDAYKKENHGWDFFYKEDDDLMEFFVRYIESTVARPGGEYR